ncbi:mannose-6-phosphate isomerase [Bacillus mesophilus]|uniref:Mannose-6-phosphate isomerase n=1 Tax=Bacillus mesophilus TaxID=1808955 RepID=A0A6M0Q7S8_9BACI|nr:mannose-6-phosphate isomerase, class I [Bacillus mesophilus]MBM7661754.1 mannose-6-phosphate isomerase [Bacillus mesophilus]NEY72412.1 mannose-6-phosphate isomerase, class I [Bacillus mesophilus]
MYHQPIFLKPVFMDRIWGGTKLGEEYNYEIPTETTGECWGISAHPNGPSEILNGPLQGKTLIEAWQNHRELFANQDGDEFPLLTKILDARDDLSVQVHPDNVYAKEVENYPYGKTECWYIIDCEEDAEIIFGHHAVSKEELQRMVENGEWSELLRRVKVKPGDFYYIPSGTIHAIGKGIMILETQQSSDITYRVYDYDRTDAEGNKRELHITKSIDVTTIPHIETNSKPILSVEQGLTSKQLIKEENFTVYHCKLSGTVSKETKENYFLHSVLNGEGSIVTSEGEFTFKKGDHFIVPSTVKEYRLIGNAEFIVSSP